MVAGIARLELSLRKVPGKGDTVRQCWPLFIFDSYLARRGMQIFPVGRPCSHPNRTQRVSAPQK